MKLRIVVSGGNFFFSLCLHRSDAFVNVFIQLTCCFWPRADVRTDKRFSSTLSLPLLRTTPYSFASLISFSFTPLATCKPATTAHVVCVDLIRILCVIVCSKRMRYDKLSYYEKKINSLSYYDYFCWNFHWVQKFFFFFFIFTVNFTSKNSPFFKIQLKITLRKFTIIYNIKASGEFFDWITTRKIQSHSQVSCKTFTSINQRVGVHYSKRLSVSWGSYIKTVSVIQINIYVYVYVARGIVAQQIRHLLREPTLVVCMATCVLLGLVLYEYVDHNRTRALAMFPAGLYGRIVTRIKAFFGGIKYPGLPVLP